MQQTVLLFSVVIFYTIQKLFAWLKAVRSVHNFPGGRTLLSPQSFIGNILPKIRYITDGGNSHFCNKHGPFEKYGWDIHTHASIGLYPSITTCIVLADAEAIKEVTTFRSRFPKPVHHYESLSFYGRNIVASEGDEWKKYRKISAPAFSDRNNALVWNESINTVKDLFTNMWADHDIITVDHCADITLPMTLFIICAAGFGKSVSWKADAIPPPGYKLTFKEAVHLVTTNIFIKLAVPSWALNLTENFQKTNIAFDELRRYMSEMIHERQLSEKKQRYDLFASLLEANESTLDIDSLSEDELIGNIYIFLVAGHETTGHTICFALALLALYPEEQQRLYEHIKSVPKSETTHEPTYEQMPLLTYTAAVLNETLRMFPPVTGIPKVTAEDMILSTSNSDGESVNVPVPKGADISINVPALHYNPRYWKDPYTFKPSRFLEEWPRDAFIPFSGGARACLGRKFGETESIAILTMLVSHYKITVKDEQEFSNETFEQRKARVLASRAGLTLTPLRVPLTFTRR